MRIRDPHSGMFLRPYWWGGDIPLFAAFYAAPAARCTRFSEIEPNLPMQYPARALRPFDAPSTVFACNLSENVLCCRWYFFGGTGRCTTADGS